MSGFVEKPEPVQVSGLTHLHTGKVRDLYRNEAGDLVMVASDRMSAYDWVLPTEIPDKGRVLTRLSLWWFDQLADLVPNHVLSTELPAGAPADWAGRTLVCKSLRMVQVECVARGYLTGSGLVEYNRSRTVCGIGLPEGLLDGSELPGPIFTPATKAAVGDHDENVSYEEVAREVGVETAAPAAADHPGRLPQGPGRRARAGDHPRRHEVRVRLRAHGGRRRAADPRGRGADPRLLPLLAYRGLGAGPCPALVRQAVRPGLADLAGLRLGPRERAAAPGAAAGDRRRDPGQVHRGVRAADRQQLVAAGSRVRRTARRPRS
ncbi:hypothetical protein ACVWXU_005220 [Streptomyces sp. TE33382]